MKNLTQEQKILIAAFKVVINKIEKIQENLETTNQYTDMYERGVEFGKFDMTEDIIEEVKDLIKSVKA